MTSEAMSDTPEKNSKRPRENEELDYLRKDPRLIESSFADNYEASIFPFTEETFPYLQATKEWLEETFQCIYCSEWIERKQSFGQLNCSYHPKTLERIEIRLEQNYYGTYYPVYSNVYECCKHTQESKGCTPCDHSDRIHTKSTVLIPEYFICKDLIVNVWAEAVLDTVYVFERLDSEKDKESTTNTPVDVHSQIPIRERKFDLFRTYHTIKRY